MADEKTTSGSEDPILNIKKEMERKLGNVDQKLSSLEQTNQALLAQLKSMSVSAPKQAAKSTDLDKVWFDKPEEAAEEIVKRAEARISKSMDARIADQSRQQNTLSALVSEFPELSDGNHELTQAAVKAYNEMSDEDKRSPVAYKAAVKEAALDLGYKPMKKRSEEEQEFSLRGGSRSSRQDGNTRKSADKLAPETEEFARLMGIDVDNPETKKRLANKHGRKNYTRYA